MSSSVIDNSVGAPQQVGKRAIEQQLLLCCYRKCVQKKIPDSIGELKTLMHIDASHNCLTVIGDKLDGLSLLQTLNLAFNEDLDETTMSEKCKRHLSMVSFVYSIFMNKVSKKNYKP